MADLQIAGLRKSYDGRRDAIGDVSLEVPDGTTLTVLGPSGCGKSTLLRVVAGLEHPDAGDVFIDGTRVTDHEPRDRDIAMVFQSYALYPHMHVFDNISIALRLRRLPKHEIRSRVTRVAEMLDIAELLERRPRELSGGERQRVALARAIVRQPKMFLLDEPLSNLDALLRERAREELKALFLQMRATVVYVTHDQVEALTLSDQVAVMRDGRLEQVGTADSIYQRPATLFVAAFVGSPRMNVVPGALVGVDAASVGIRPEDVAVGLEGQIEMALVMRESLGGQRLLTLGKDALRLRALVPSTVPLPDRSTLWVTLDPRHLHRFDHQGHRMDDRG